MDLLQQQQARRQDLLATLRHMEGVKGTDDSELFWLQQYQRLLETSSHQLSQVVRAVDGKLQQALTVNGVIHFLPLLAHKVLSRDDIALINDDDLRKVSNVSFLNRLKTGVHTVCFPGIFEVCTVACVVDTDTVISRYDKGHRTVA